MRKESKKIQKAAKKPFEEFEGSDRSKTITSGEHPYSPDVYLVLKEYEIPSVLVQMEENLEQIVLDFIAKANPDEYNTSFMDARIQLVEAEALASLALQRNEHVYGQKEYIDKTLKRGRIDYEAMRKHHVQELEELEQEIAEYKDVINKGTPFEKRVKTMSKEG